MHAYQNPSCNCIQGNNLYTLKKSTLLKMEKVAIIPSDNPKSTRFTNIALIEGASVIQAVCSWSLLA